MLAVQVHEFQALDKAKEAGRKERVLVRQREQQTTAEQANLDLTYSVSHFASVYLLLFCMSMYVFSGVTFTQFFYVSSLLKWVMKYDWFCDMHSRIWYVTHTHTHKQDNVPHQHSLFVYDCLSHTLVGL